MQRKYVNELKDGDTVEEVFLVADKQLRANRNAALYLSLDLRDKTGLMNGRMWNVTEDSVSGVQSGGFVRIRGKVQLFQGALQMILSHVDPVAMDGLDLSEFEPQPDKDIEQLQQRLREILLSLNEPNLRTLMDAFLQDDELMQAFAQTPAGVKAHHAYRGGLLEHVVTMLEAARRIGEVYPELDIDLLLCGVFLHDLGKVRELSCEAGFVYTDEGQLLGHLIIGIELLTGKIAHVTQLTGHPFPQELALRLKHMILSHHGAYEFGSPKLPMTPEAVALHHLDNLDAKVHEFTRAIQDDPNAESHWTLFNTRLARKIYKGGPATNGF